MKYSKIIAPRLVSYRESRRISRQQMAEVVRIPVSRLGRIERGELSPTIDELVNIGLALDVRIVEMIYGEDSGLIDIGRHWPRNQSIITQIIRMLRTFEEYVESQWVDYCANTLEPHFKKLLSEGRTTSSKNAPKPPWKIRNL